MKGFFINCIQDFLTRHPALNRFLSYRNPRRYWQKRGGDLYYQQQEAVAERQLRSQFILERLTRLSYANVLEIGCGYGKQLKNLKTGPDCLVVGIDWSRPQLIKAKEVCGPIEPVLIEGDAARLPFRDKSFDLVLTSAVIMHNAEPQAQQIIHEILRVGKRYVAHNEDTNVTFKRRGYDMCKTYKKMGIKILESGPIELNPPVSNTQFTLVDLNSTDSLPRSSEEIPLQYHHREA